MMQLGPGAAQLKDANRRDELKETESPVSLQAGVECAANSVQRGRILMLGTDPATRGGVASVVATLRDAGMFQEARVEYLATHVEGGRLRKAWHFLTAVASVFQILQSRRVLIVHAHVSSRGSFWRKAVLLWLARQFNVATIAHLHDGRFGVFAQTGFGGFALRRCIRGTLESSTGVIVLSAQLRDWVREFAPRSSVRVIGNPVRCPAPRPSTAASAQNSTGRILFLGRICAEKGAFDLLEAFASFAPDHPGWRLVVGGDGEVDRLLAEAGVRGVREQVDYLGWVSGADKEQALCCADIFALPSYSEGMPVSILEAMACGLAVLATPVGGVPDMMQPQLHGLWTEPGDIEALANAIEQLASSYELRMTLGAAARQHVLDNFSVEIVISKIWEAYAAVQTTGTR